MRGDHGFAYVTAPRSALGGRRRVAEGAETSDHQRLGSEAEVLNLEEVLVCSGINVQPSAGSRSRRGSFRSLDTEYFETWPGPDGAAHLRVAAVMLSAIADVLIANGFAFTVQPTTPITAPDDTPGTGPCFWCTRLTPLAAARSRERSRHPRIRVTASARAHWGPGADRGPRGGRTGRARSDGPALPRGRRHSLGWSAYEPLA